MKLEMLCTWEQESVLLEERSINISVVIRMPYHNNQHMKECQKNHYLL